MHIITIVITNIRSLRIYSNIRLTFEYTEYSNICPTPNWWSKRVDIQLYNVLLAYILYICIYYSSQLYENMLYIDIPPSCKNRMGEIGVA